MLYQVGEVQSVDAVSDNKVNRFNGTGVGIYATSNGKQSINKASYQWFEYKEENSLKTEKLLLNLFSYN